MGAGRAESHPWAPSSILAHEAGLKGRGPWTAQLGGKCAYEGRLGKDRSARQSRHPIAREMGFIAEQKSQIPQHWPRSTLSGRVTAVRSCVILFLD
jgi:hypothetical protein